MNKLLGIGLVGSLALAACGTQVQAPVGGTERDVPFTRQGTADPNPAGNASIVTLSDGTTATTLTLSGLTPGQTYVAHYHQQGTEGVPACESGGAIVGSNDGQIGGDAFAADDNGNLVIRGLDATEALSNAAYINVHYGDSLGTVPLCADL